MAEDLLPRGVKVLIWIPGSGANSVINVNPEDWYAYAEGYKLGADLLAKHVVDEEWDQDFLVYPAVFLYRHYLELRLKEILVRGRWLAGLPPVSPSSYGHNLKSLWRDARETLQLIWPDSESRRHDESIERVVMEFAETDPGSFAFRFPVTRGGGASLPDLKAINLGHVAGVIGKVAPFLDGAVLGIEESGKAKAEADYYAARDAAEAAYRDGTFDYGDQGPDDER